MPQVQPSTAQTVAQQVPTAHRRKAYSTKIEPHVLAWFNDRVPAAEQGPFADEAVSRILELSNDDACRLFWFVFQFDYRTTRCETLPPEEQWVPARLRLSQPTHGAWMKGWRAKLRGHTAQVGITATLLLLLYERFPKDARHRFPQLPIDANRRPPDDPVIATIGAGFGGMSTVRNNSSKRHTRDVAEFAGYVRTFAETAARAAMHTG